MCCGICGIPEVIIFCADFKWQVQATDGMYDYAVSVKILYGSLSR